MIRILVIIIKKWLILNSRPKNIIYFRETKNANELCEATPASNRAADIKGTEFLIRQFYDMNN